MMCLMSRRCSGASEVCVAVRVLLIDHSESAVRLPALRFSHTSNVSGSLGEFDPLHELTARQCLRVKLQTFQDFHNKRAIKGTHQPLRLMLEWLL